MHPDLPLGALISLIRRNHIVALNTRLKPLGLSAAQVPVLLYLSRREGVSQEAIARFFHLDKATIARGVRRLEEDAFVCRRVDPDNRRAYGLYLTGKGKEIIAEILEIEAGWEEELLAVLSEQERQDAIHLLRTLAEHSLAIAGVEHDCDTA
ncbi:MAG: MarR family transcriptional regulator [Methanomicrobiales archaeon]|nr:MarR family transcriptional regulator [Methanomicrobiales archaeon]MDI6877369.1 MarR family transcriptional regulator [Methanomicrobiales archaeon]